MLSSLKRPHLEYFRDFYGDTAMFGGRSGLQAGIDFSGRITWCSRPMAPLGPIKDTIDVLKGQGLAPADLSKILSGNAKRLMRM